MVHDFSSSSGTPTPLHNQECSLNNSYISVSTVLGVPDECCRQCFRHKDFPACCHTIVSLQPLLLLSNRIFLNYLLHPLDLALVLLHRLLPHDHFLLVLLQLVLLVVQLDAQTGLLGLKLQAVRERPQASQQRRSD